MYICSVFNNQTSKIMLKYYRNVKNGEVKPLSPEIIKAAGTSDTWALLTDAELADYRNENSKVEENVEAPVIPQPTLGEKQDGKVVSFPEQVPSAPVPAPTAAKKTGPKSKAEKEETPVVPQPAPAPINTPDEEEEEPVETVSADEV